ncbi:hypothetical protein K5549_021420, partial [Capra hircus]
QNSPPKEYESDDDFYDMLDLTEYVKRHHWWNPVFGHSSGPVVENHSVATQIVMDEVSDRYVGFLFQKVGKLAATAVGGGFLLLQIASHSGCVQINWKGVEKGINKAKEQHLKSATELVKQNLVVSGGFVGSFLLGLESSGYECSVIVGSPLRSGGDKMISTFLNGTFSRMTRNT